MLSEPIPVQAPQDAVAWTPSTGWVYDTADLPEQVDEGHHTLVVDGRSVYVDPVAMATLATVVRLDTDVSGLAQRVRDIDDLWRRLTTISEFAAAQLSQRRELWWGDRPPDEK